MRRVTAKKNLPKSYKNVENVKKRDNFFKRLKTWNKKCRT